MRFRLKNKTDDGGTPRRRQQNHQNTANEVVEERSFRRNRTLTGSLSSHVASSNEGKAELRSPRVHAHHLAMLRQRVAGALGTTLLVSLGLYLLIGQFTAQATITMDGLASDPSAQKIYEPLIQEYLAQRPIERLRFLTNTEELTRFIQVHAPEIENIHIEGSGKFATSSFTLTARRPITGWTIGGVQQYVDADGMAFSRNYYAQPSVVIVDKSGIPASSGQAVASNRFLGFVGRLVGLVKRAGLDAEQVIIPSGTTRQIDLKLKDIAYTVKCSVDRPAGEQAEDMSRAIAYLRNNGTTPSYVDVRISGKAYYR
jgi:hypothetical protein